MIEQLEKMLQRVEEIEVGMSGKPPVQKTPEPTPTPETEEEIILSELEKKYKDQLSERAIKINDFKNKIEKASKRLEELKTIRSGELVGSDILWRANEEIGQLESELLTAESDLEAAEGGEEFKLWTDPGMHERKTIAELSNGVGVASLEIGEGKAGPVYDGIAKI